MGFNSGFKGLIAFAPSSLNSYVNYTDLLLFAARFV